MKDFLEPKLEVALFELEDIMTLSVLPEEDEDEVIELPKA